MFTKKFWRSVAERAISTWAQAFVGAYAVTGLDLAMLKGAALIATVAAVLSVVKSVAVATATDGSPSIGSSETVTAEPSTYVPEHAAEDVPEGVPAPEEPILS